MTETSNIFQHMFGKFHIIGFAGSKNEGKTNNLIAAMIDFRRTNKHTPIYYYGFDREVSDWISQNISGAKELSSLAQFNSKDKKRSLFIIDEFQRLQLNDRRYRDLVSDFINLVYHQNNWLILASPDLKEFNSIIGSKIERWVLKSLRIDELVRGSQLKEAALSYKGSGGFGGLGLQVGKNEAIVINNDRELMIQFDYIEEADNKRKLNNIFLSAEMSGEMSALQVGKNVREMSGECQVNVREMSGECQVNVGRMSESKVSSGPGSHFTSSEGKAHPRMIRHFTSELDTTKDEELGTTSVIMSKLDDGKRIQDMRN